MHQHLLDPARNYLNTPQRNNMCAMLPSHHECCQLYKVLYDGAVAMYKNEEDLSGGIGNTSTQKGLYHMLLGCEI